MKKIKVEELCDRELLEEILRVVQGKKSLSGNNDLPEQPSRVYSNKEVMDMLGVKDKYMKKLRDNGYIGYSREGDKYWYTQDDIDKFLHRFHYEAFATNPNLPRQEGGRV
jgi:hypothetical protein